MTIVAISDTHGQHHNLTLPQGDVLIHAGDCTYRGTESEVKDFLDWFSSQDYQYKILIAGNHDFFFERADPLKIKSVIPEKVIYLNDSGISIEGLNFWGSPITPWFFDWAFNRHRGSEIKTHWDLIPENTDILITHGPVHGILDKTIYGKKVGCEALCDKITEIRPKAHIFGHIHEAYGQLFRQDTLFVNASILDVRYKLINKPVMFNL